MVQTLACFCSKNEMKNMKKVLTPQGPIQCQGCYQGVYSNSLVAQDRMIWNPFTRVSTNTLLVCTLSLDIVASVGRYKESKG